MHCTHAIFLQTCAAYECTSPVPPSQCVVVPVGAWEVDDTNTAYSVFKVELKPGESTRTQVPATQVEQTMVIAVPREGLRPVVHLIDAAASQGVKGITTNTEATHATLDAFTAAVLSPASCSAPLRWIEKEDKQLRDYYR